MRHRPSFFLRRCVTRFFGMNTKGLPFGNSDYGTLYAGALCCLAAGLAYLLIRRYRMLS